MVTRSFGKKNFLQSSWTLIFSFWVLGWRGIFSFFPLFPMCSHQVSKRFPDMFPMAPRFYGYSFAHNSTPMHINWNLGEHVCFYFATGVRRPASIGGMPNVPKKIVDGPIDMAPWKNIYISSTNSPWFSKKFNNSNNRPETIGSFPVLEFPSVLWGFFEN